MTEQTNNTNVVVTIEGLLDGTIEVMEGRLVTKGEDYYLRMTPTGFENEVETCLNIAAEGTNFENRVVYFGGGKFPDFVVADIYGVEVKRAKGNTLTTIGNSVLESTRVGGVEKIYLLFGKLSGDIVFVWRPYEECLSEVAVTHYPRYLVDMELGEDETIFDKMGKTYEEICSCPKPVEPIVDYYRGLLKPGESLWWIDNGGAEEEVATDIIIRQWNTLDAAHRDRIRIGAMVLFPQLFGNDRTKYDGVSAWLVKTHGVVCKNIRDLFTAGGKYEIPDGDDTVKVQHIVSNIDGDDDVDSIVSFLRDTDIEELEEYWEIRDLEEGEQVEVWLREVCDYLDDENASRYLMGIYEDYLS